MKPAGDAGLSILHDLGTAPGADIGRGRRPAGGGSARPRSPFVTVELWNMAIDRQRIYHKRDRLRQLRAFCHAAHFGSATRAADRLSISQPAVSLHVRELEHEMEAVLFERHGPNIALTPAGQQLYEIALPLVESMDRLSETFASGIEGSESGELCIAAGPSATAFVLPPHLLRFREKYPEVKVRVKNLLVSDGLRLVADGDADFVLGAEEPFSGEFRYHPSFSYHHVLVAPEDHPLAGRDDVAISEAARYPAIVPPSDTYERQPDASAARRFVTEASVVMTTSGWGVIKQYVESGFGIAVVPTMCLGKGDRLSVVPLREEQAELSYGIFTPNDRTLSQPAERFVGMLVPGIAGSS